MGIRILVGCKVVILEQLFAKTSRGMEIFLVKK